MTSHVYITINLCQQSFLPFYTCIYFFKCWHRLNESVKGIQAVRIEFFFILKVANIRCFIQIAVEIFHNVIRK